MPVSPQRFDPRKFFDVANEVVRGGRSESRLRMAVGRAYYACFITARDWARVTNHDRVHAHVIEILQKHHPRLGDKLALLKNYRLAADYQMVPDNRQFYDWEKNWENVRRETERLLEELSRLEPLRDSGE